MIFTDTTVALSTHKALCEGYPVIIHQGGTYSGKTYNVLLALGMYLFEKPRNKVVRVIGQTYGHLKNGAMADWMEINDFFKFSTQYQAINKTYIVNGSRMRFESVDTLGKAKGVKSDITYINEINYMKYPIYKQIKLRTNETLIMDYNPTGHFWLHEKELPIFNKYLFKLTTYKDNPALPKGKAKELEALKDQDEQLYRVYTLGKTGQIKGLVFKSFNIVDEMPVALKNKGYGLDFGFSNSPTALVKCGINGGEIWLEEMIYQTRLTNQDISDRLKELNIKKSETIVGDSAEPKSIEELRRLGWRCFEAKKGKDSVKHGLQLLTNYKINVTKNSTNIIKELRNYKWKVDNSDEPTNNPVDAFNHAIDAIRYWASKLLSKKNINFYGLKNKI